jgi:uncharacterized protein (TIGR02996 family)
MGLDADPSPFVAALAEDATDFTTLAVFADWLEEHGHTALGVRFRKLMPQTGDLLVYQLKRGNYFEQMPHVRDAALAICKTLQEDFGIITCWLVLPEYMELRQVDEVIMRDLGWIRAPQEGVPGE